MQLRNRTEPGSSAAAESPSGSTDNLSDVGNQGIQIAAATLLAVESKVRAARDESEVVHLIANELRRLAAGRQVIVFRAHKPGKFIVKCVSSVALTDRETPFVRWIEGMVQRLQKEGDITTMRTFRLSEYADENASETHSYPFGHLVWLPFVLVSGETFGGALVAREKPWGEADRMLLGREASVFANAWQAVHGARSMRPRQQFSRRVRVIMGIMALVVAVMPVPLTTLAPVEIVAKDPQRVTAPLDGVVKDILIDPDRAVRAGEEILRLDETTLRNRQQVAEQEMLVAEARHQRLARAAFTDEQSRRELAQARVEHALKKAEWEYAAELLGRTVVRAERDGVLVYADKDRWIGRPVRTGERIMQIVDTGKVIARIEMPVADAIVLQQSARVRLFLDADPLNAIPARLSSEGYHAEPNSAQQLVYRLMAEVEARSDGLRIGARGTAQLQGRYVPLCFYLLRRPITAVRQYVGL